MKLFIQNKYEAGFRKKIEDLGYLLKTDESFIFVNNEMETADVVIVDLEYFDKIPSLRNSRKNKILLHSNPFIHIEAVNLNSVLAIINPILGKQDQYILQKSLEKIQQEINISKIKNEIQAKRKVLENLNAKLQLQSNKKLESLVLSHEEETKKNQNEKMLLHFLEFIRTESLRDDFISLLLKFLWKDFKKTGHVYQIGFCIQTSPQQSYFVNFNGEFEKIHFANDSIQGLLEANRLATFFGRPVGKVIHWQLPKFSKEAIFFIELVDPNFSENIVRQYFKERLTLLSLYLDRWMIEKEYKMQVDKWDKTFAAFQGLAHVIDENYVIQKANYLNLEKQTQPSICYKILAGRNAPCASCPIGKSKPTEFYLKENQRVKGNASTFTMEQKNYHFVFYEDLTTVDQLKTQIIQSERMSALGRLGNYLSHEINNPLTGLKSYIQWIQSDSLKHSLPSTLIKDLEEVLKATQRSEKIVANLLSFTQGDQVHLELGNFKEVLDNTLTLLKTALRKHRIFIDLKTDPILIDRQGLQQVLFNLIKNSCQALEKEGIIKIFQEVNMNEYIYTIEDNGPGLNQEIKDNLFLPFMTTKKEGEGTGLGLYLSRRLMERMNAKLKIDTERLHGFKAQLIFKKVSVP